MKVENLFSVDKKTVLITGGSRGIGEMIASGFCANGAKVYITARSGNVVKETAKILSDNEDVLNIYKKKIHLFLHIKVKKNRRKIDNLEG